MQYIDHEMLSSVVGGLGGGYDVHTNRPTTEQKAEFAQCMKDAQTPEAKQFCAGRFMHQIQTNTVKEWRV